MACGCIVPFISGIGQDAIDLSPGDRLDVGDDSRKCVAVIRIAGQGLGVERELAALGALEGSCH